MNKKYILTIFSIIFAVLTNHQVMSQKIQEINNPITDLITSKLIENNTKSVTIAGKPVLQECKYGKAVAFNGSSDAIFLDSMPLAGLDQFTIEVIFQPSGGNFEQRFLHIGEAQGDRVLLELRATQTDWYFDAFIKTADQQCTLIEPKLLHPLNQWYHVAYVIDKGKLTTYVNGIKELEGNIILTPLKTGQTSIGVRQNLVSWFKGMIYKVRITTTPLSPSDFIKF
jgi:hypothetical protein